MKEQDREYLVAVTYTRTDRAANPVWQVIRRDTLEVVDAFKTMVEAKEFCDTLMEGKK